MRRPTSYVSLKFNSAKLFRALMTDKFNIQLTFKEPITRYQMANVLYALTNQKLVNTRRYSYFKHQDSFLEWADECLIKFVPQPTIDYKETERTPMSIMSLNKDKTGSTSMSPTRWKQIRYELMIRHGLKEKGYAKFLEFMKTTYGVTEDMSIEEFFVEVYKTEKWIKMFDFLVEHLNPKMSGRFLSVVGFYATFKESNVEVVKKEGLRGFGYEFPLKNVTNSDLNILKCTKNILTSHINHKGVGGYERYDGEILVPIRTNGDMTTPIEEFEDYILLQNGPGVATILDGGSITIDAIKNSREIHRLNKYTKIKDISLEEVQYFDLTTLK